MQKRSWKQMLVLLLAVCRVTGTGVQCSQHTEGADQCP